MSERAGRYGVRGLLSCIREHPASESTSRDAWLMVVQDEPFWTITAGMMTGETVMAAAATGAATTAAGATTGTVETAGATAGGPMHHSFDHHGACTADRLT